MSPRRHTPHECFHLLHCLVHEEPVQVDFWQIPLCVFAVVLLQIAAARDFGQELYIFFHALRLIFVFVGLHSVPGRHATCRHPHLLTPLHLLIADHLKQILPSNPRPSQLGHNAILQRIISLIPHHQLPAPTRILLHHLPLIAHPSPPCTPPHTRPCLALAVIVEVVLCIFILFHISIFREPLISVAVALRRVMLHRKRQVMQRMASCKRVIACHLTKILARNIYIALAAHPHILHGGLSC
mmetsp:Transcript_22501/g.33005  ORF Transcript_22501/g.33005 Transcript_22501/m.33005 type:complete len:241 (+) Transcript_22501:229-951(+)